jgi:hypothetical protein
MTKTPTFNEEIETHKRDTGKIARDVRERPGRCGFVEFAGGKAFIKKRELSYAKGFFKFKDKK